MCRHLWWFPKFWLRTARDGSGRLGTAQDGSGRLGTAQDGYRWGVMEKNKKGTNIDVLRGSLSSFLFWKRWIACRSNFFNETGSMPFYFSLKRAACRSIFDWNGQHTVLFLIEKGSIPFYFLLKRAACRSFFYWNGQHAVLFFIETGSMPFYFSLKRAACRSILFPLKHKMPMKHVFKAS